MTLLLLPLKALPVLLLAVLMLVGLDVGGIRQPAVEAYFSSVTWLVDRVTAPLFDSLAPNPGPDS